MEIINWDYVAEFLLLLLFDIDLLNLNFDLCDYSLLGSWPSALEVQQRQPNKIYRWVMYLSSFKYY